MGILCMIGGGIVGGIAGMIKGWHEGKQHGQASRDIRADLDRYFAGDSPHGTADHKCTLECYLNDEDKGK